MTTHATPSSQQAGSPTEQKPLDVQQTTCCVVGGGPGGAVLALLLARKGIDVALLGAHGDFDRDFRGDTLYPSIMENMTKLGLADRLLKLRHSKVPALTLDSTESFTPPAFMRSLPRVPVLRKLPACLIAFSVWPVRVRK